jgi:outer membrane protein OmpA-like peptidoglycan-associated protein
MRSIFFGFCLAIILCAAQASAQERSAFGLFGHFGLNMHTANFQKLPGVPNCCPRFEEGSGTGVSFGALYELPLAELFALQLRAGYQSLNGELTAAEPTTVLHEGSATAGEFIHYLDATLATVGIEVLPGFRVMDALRINVGLGAGMVLTRNYDQREEISKPDGAGTFLDSLGNDTRSRVRNKFSGEIPTASSFRLALLGGISYSLPLNAGRTLFLSPEALYSFGLTPVASDLEWSVHSLRLGVAVTWSPREEVSVAIADVPVAPPTTPTTPATPPKPALSASIVASGVNAAGVESPVVRLTVEEFSSTLMTPLLNYLFFDENSADIPARYHRLQGGDVSAFDIDRVNSAEKLPTYHHLLNIIGRRLRDNPTATLTLTGCNQDIRDEKGNTQLSGQRAEAVRAYLKDVWGIADNRITIEARNLPVKAANTETQDGAEENRRVEITSNDGRILAPIITSDTLRKTDPPAMRFRTGAVAEAGMSSWQLTVMQDGKLLKRFEGTGDVPAVVDWDIERETGTTPRFQGDMQYALTARDAAGTEGRAEHAIPVEQLTISKKRVERRGDMEIDRSSLILFDVRSAEISSAGAAIIPLIQDRIQPTSTVTVTGYTDRLGDAAYNQQLADGRAAAVAKALGMGAGTGVSKGIGEADLYDSSLPEGRLYTRTVDVVIETPVQE